MASSMVIQTCSNTAIFSRGVWKAAYGDTKTMPFDTVCEEPNICLCLLCHVFRNSVETTIVSPGTPEECRARSMKVEAIRPPCINRSRGVAPRGTFPKDARRLPSKVVCQAFEINSCST